MNGSRDRFNFCVFYIDPNLFLPQLSHDHLAQYSVVLDQPLIHFPQNFSFLVGNPESDDLYLTVYDANIKDSDERGRHPLGTLKVVVSNLLRRRGMEYLCQPWKLNSTHGFDDSNVVLSLKLLFVKPSDAEGMDCFVHHCTTIFMSDKLILKLHSQPVRMSASL